MDGDAVAVPGAGKTQHPAHFVDAFHVLEKSFGGPFRPVGIAGQEDGFGDLARFGPDMDGHGYSLVQQAVIWRLDDANGGRGARG